MLNEINQTMQTQFNDSFYSRDELENMGFKNIGNNVLISRFARFYGINNISIGNNVRIDDFAILSGNITLGNFIHISAHSGITGGSEGVVFGDFCSLSLGSKILSSTDDLSGGFLINSCVPLKYRNVKQSKIILPKHNHIGALSIVLPNTIFEIGANLGPNSLIADKTLKSFGYYFGSPARLFTQIDKNSVLQREEQLLNGGGRLYKNKIYTIKNTKSIAKIQKKLSKNYLNRQCA